MFNIEKCVNLHQTSSLQGHIVILYFDLSMSNSAKCISLGFKYSGIKKR